MEHTFYLKITKNIWSGQILLGFKLKPLKNFDSRWQRDAFVCLLFSIENRGSFFVI